MTHIYTKITNPCPGATKATAIMANIDESDHKFLFRKVFASDRGIRQALIATFIKRYVEALRAAGVKEEWDEEQYAKAAEVLARMNFGETVAPIVKPKAASPVKPKRSLASREASNV